MFYSWLNETLIELTSCLCNSQHIKTKFCFKNVSNSIETLGIKLISYLCDSQHIKKKVTRVFKSSKLYLKKTTLKNFFE